MSRMADILTRLVGPLFGEISAALPEESYTRGTTQVVGSLLLLAAREYEEGADMLVWENKEIRKLLGEGAALMNEAEASTRMEQAARTLDESFLISTLEKNNDALKRMLIELHSAVEHRGDDASQKMNEAIWKFLRESAEKHRIDFF